MLYNHWHAIRFTLLRVCRSFDMRYRHLTQLQSPSGTSLILRHVMWNTFGHVSQQIISPYSPQISHRSSFEEELSASPADSDSLSDYYIRSLVRCSCVSSFSPWDSVYEPDPPLNRTQKNLLWPAFTTELTPYPCLCILRLCGCRSLYLCLYLCAFPCFFLCSLSFQALWSENATLRIS